MLKMCLNCHGKGETLRNFMCIVCRGSGKVDVPEGMKICTTCKGKGAIYVQTSEYGATKQLCPSCGGNCYISEAKKNEE